MLIDHAEMHFATSGCSYIQNVFKQNEDSPLTTYHPRLLLITAQHNVDMDMQNKWI